jgi:hypothetical protein
MTSGSKIRIERWCRWLVAALAFTASSAWAFDLPELMGLLARQKNGEARFTEQRFVRGIEMEFIGGDRSVMSITPVRGAS